NNAAGSAPAGTTLTDSIGNLVAVVRGTGATLTGSAITLPGGTTGNQTAAAISGYVDLPNNIIHTKPNLTVEAWATPISSKKDQRLWDFGRANLTVGTGSVTGEIIESGTAPGAFVASDNLVLSINAGTIFNDNRLEGQYNGAAAILTETNLTDTTTAGTEYHYVVTVEDGVGTSGTAGCVAKWYRNGVLQSVLNLNF